MEWISFTLDSEKKTVFETELMPNLCKKYASLFNTFGQTWTAYYDRIGLDTYRYFFYSDSPLLLGFVKEFSVNHTEIYTAPQTEEMNILNPGTFGKIPI